MTTRTRPRLPGDTLRDQTSAHIVDLESSPVFGQIASIVLNPIVLSRRDHEVGTDGYSDRRTPGGRQTLSTRIPQIRQETSSVTAATYIREPSDPSDIQTNVQGY